MGAETSGFYTGDYRACVLGTQCTYQYHVVKTLLRMCKEHVLSDGCGRKSIGAVLECSTDGVSGTVAEPNV